MKGRRERGRWRKEEERRRREKEKVKQGIMRKKIERCGKTKKK